MDGQVARRTERETARGAFLDSILDRYVDFALMFGVLIHALRYSQGLTVFGFGVGIGTIVLIAALAVAGSSQVSYATARAENLKTGYRRPETAGKCTRTVTIGVSGLLTPVWLHAPLAALLVLAVHTNVAGLRSLLGSRCED